MAIKTASPIETIDLTADISGPLHMRLLEYQYPTSRDGLANYVSRVYGVVNEVFLAEYLDIFRRMACDPSAPAALLLSGAPIDPDLPPTPERAQRSTVKFTSISEGFLLGTASLLGHPYSMTHERGPNSLVNDVIATREAANTPSSKGCSAFPWHTEHTGQDPRPEFLALYCLRDATGGGGATLFADGRLAYRMLSPKARRCLRKRKFFYRRPVLFSAKEHWNGPKRIFSGPHEVPRIRMSDYGMQGSTREGEAAIEELKEVLDEIVVSVTLRPGQVLYLANTYGVHARAPFDGNFDSRDRRWLQRVFVTTDPRRFPLGEDTARMIFDKFCN
jgi:L-asparagine oxygenase